MTLGSSTLRYLTLIINGSALF